MIQAKRREYLWTVPFTCSLSARPRRFPSALLLKFLRERKRAENLDDPRSPSLSTAAGVLRPPLEMEECDRDKKDLTCVLSFVSPPIGRRHLVFRAVGNASIKKLPQQNSTTQQTNPIVVDQLINQQTDKVFQVKTKNLQLLDGHGVVSSFLYN